MSFTGLELYRIWMAGKPNGLSQRKLASLLGISFNALHGKIWREQERMKKPTGDVMLNEFPRVTLRAAVFDIETTDFKAGGINDHLICCSILPLDEDEVKTIEIAFTDQRDDRNVLATTMRALEDYDILIGHNIAAFDIPWLISRLAYHGMERPMKKFLIYDTYQAARRQSIKAERKSLAFLCDFFRVEYVKTAVLPVSWSMVDSPNEDEFNKAMEDITYHCREDVKANRNLFDALWPLDKSMTNLPVYRK